MATADRRYANTDCPYCRVLLDPLPRARKRCPSCGESIYVRSAPDGLTHLLREADLPVIEQAWTAWHDEKAAAEASGINRNAASSAAAALRDYGGLGVATVDWISSDDACPACKANAGRRFPIDSVPAIPVVGCSITCAPQPASAPA